MSDPRQPSDEPGKKRKGIVLIFVLALLLVIAVAVVYFVVTGPTTNLGEGDCLSSLEKGSDGYAVVDCDDPSAAYRITDKDTGTSAARLDACDDDPGGTVISGRSGKRGKSYWEVCAVAIAKP